jgi:hypothetical protein
MKSFVSAFVLASSLFVLIASSSLAAPLVGSGTLPFPGATGDPPRDTYLAAGSASGPFTGTWPGAGPNSPSAPAWWGTFTAFGAMPHTPPVGTSVTGVASYHFTVGDGYAPGALPVGTYFHFGDLDNGSGGGETFRLRAFDPAFNLIMTPWLDTPFAASITAVASDMPNYSFTPGIYDFDGNFVPGNPTISIFLKNNTPIGYLEVAHPSTTTAFILAAPPSVPEPSSMLLMLGGALACVCRARRR